MCIQRLALTLVNGEGKDAEGGYSYMHLLALTGLQRFGAFLCDQCARSCMQAKLPEGSQTHFRSILTDQHCCVLGSEGSIYSIGDAATIQQVGRDHSGPFAVSWP